MSISIRTCSNHCLLPGLWSGNGERLARESEMTYAEFLEECNKRLIYKSLAVENEKIKQALRDRDDGLVRKLLDEEF
jgi:hypothetical protein